MPRLGRQVSLILFALAGLGMAHTAAYLLMFRCWSCHDNVVSATHASFAGSSACVLAIVVLVAMLNAGRTARMTSAPISTHRVLVAQAGAFVILQLVGGHGSLSQTLTDPTLILELGLLLVNGVLLARFARAVERVVCSIRSRGSLGRPVTDLHPPRPPALSNGPRATAYNATGFLRAPPLPA